MSNAIQVDYVFFLIYKYGKMFGIRDTFYGFAIAFSTFKNTEVWFILSLFYSSSHVIIVI